MSNFFRFIACDANRKILSAELIRSIVASDLF